VHQNVCAAINVLQIYINASFVPKKFCIYFFYVKCKYSEMNDYTYCIMKIINYSIVTPHGSELSPRINENSSHLRKNLAYCK